MTWATTTNIIDKNDETNSIDDNSNSNLSLSLNIFHDEGILTVVIAMLSYPNNLSLQAW